MTKKKATTPCECRAGAGCDYCAGLIERATEAGRVAGIREAAATMEEEIHEDAVGAILDHLTNWPCRCAQVKAGIALRCLRAPAMQLAAVIRAEWEAGEG